MNHKNLKKIKVLPNSEPMRSDPEPVIPSEETTPKNDHPVSPPPSTHETNSIAEATTSEERKVPRKSAISSEKVLPMVNDIFERKSQRRKRKVEEKVDSKVKELLETL